MPLTPPAAARFALLGLTGVGLSLALAGCGTSGSPAATASTSAAISTASPGTTMPGTGSMSGHSMGMGSTSYPPVTPGAAAAGTHNDADVAFADGMIPHHGQAVVMSDMILARSDEPKVKALAEDIKKAQMPEIATMSGWLKGWGAPVPDPYSHAGGMPGMSHGGMMSAEQMQQLMGAMGRDADRMFLTHMIEHHKGAVEMAKTELSGGANPQAKALAQQVVVDQTKEIATMEQLLATLR